MATYVVLKRYAGHKLHSCVYGYRHSSCLLLCASVVRNRSTNNQPLAVVDPPARPPPGPFVCIVHRTHERIRDLFWNFRKITIVRMRCCPRTQEATCRFSSRVRCVCSACLLVAIIHRPDQNGQQRGTEERFLKLSAGAHLQLQCCLVSTSPNGC